MYISSLAGSGKISNKSLSYIYDAYVLFDNQLNFLEVSFNREIQNEYQLIKNNMDIDANIEKMTKQIEALRMVDINKKDKKQNNILAFISVISLVTGCIQVTDSFSVLTNMYANIAVGGISFIIGIVLLYIFIR